MLNLLKSDFYKLVKSKAFLVCVLASMAMGLLFVPILSAGVTNAASVDGAGAVEELAVVLFTGFNIYVMAAFVPLFTANEFSQGTIKNILSRGSRRTQVYLSKFVVSACANVVMLLAFSLTFLAVGTFAWGYDPNGVASFASVAGMVSMEALLIIAYSALFVFTSMTMRGTVGAIATNVMSLAAVTMLLNSVSSLFSETFSLSQFWIGWGITELATLTPASGVVVQGILIALGWIAVTIAAGTTLFKRVDVK